MEGYAVERAGGIGSEIEAEFGKEILAVQGTRDRIPTLWVSPAGIRGVLRRLKAHPDGPYPMLYDLTAVDERTRRARDGLPPSDFTLVYHLLSLARNEDIRIKVPLLGESPSAPSVTGIWPSADWYEREVWDMFGVSFDGHPRLDRILMPRWWSGHPLRKEYPARATDMPPFVLPDEEEEKEMEALRFRPEERGMERRRGETEFMFLNLGPQHPGNHGVLRVVLQLDGEEIVDAVPEIGFHHRGAEKMGERQSWHTFIPYTDRIDYLGGVMNELPYLMAVEALAGIEVPDRARVIRVMLAELFRIASHLVWYGTFAADVGAMSPVFYTFNDRERVFDIVQAVCGGRMHPEWFRIGGTAQDLPAGWDRLVGEFVRSFPARLAEYDAIIMGNTILKRRAVGVGAYTAREAIEWGVTGPGLRACGVPWDFRKTRPYGGYERFDFEIPVAERGDCYDRAVVRVAEMRQSLRIVAQCLEGMPAGPHLADHPLVSPPPKERTMRDIETLIAHFLSVSWGPVIPPGEAFAGIEATKGGNGYYLVSDGGTTAYRVRIRTPSFPHIQMLPRLCRGRMIPDLIAILGSIDYVLADVDR